VESSKTYSNRFNQPYFQPDFLTKQFTKKTLVATIPKQKQTLLPYFDIV
jgi:hypothetical protein